LKERAVPTFDAKPLISEETCHLFRIFKSTFPGAFCLAFGVEREGVVCGGSTGRSWAG
jgi:hypothetical protein